MSQGSFSDLFLKGEGLNNCSIFAQWTTGRSPLQIVACSCLSLHSKIRQHLSIVIHR